jgi:thiol:disulfide interchange protein
MKKTFLFLVFFLFSLSLFGAEGDAVQVRMVIDQEKVSPGGTFSAGLEFDLPEGWMMHSPDSELGDTITIEINGGEGVKVGTLQWPPAKLIKTDIADDHGYQGKVIVPFQVNVESNRSTANPITLNGKLFFSVCSTQECLPYNLEVANSIPCVEGNFGIAEKPIELESGMLLTLLFAFLGGLILNFMPCVLPVISLKVMHFIKMGDGERSQAWKNGLLYTLGVLLSFWTLAGILAVLRMSGEAAGWGFHLQNPIFVAMLSALFFVMSLSLFGMFEIGLTLSSHAGQAESKLKGSLGALGGGVLMTLISTPCTGPMLGPVLGYAVSASMTDAFLIFTCLGLGVAFPFLLFSFFPAMTRFLPRPGNWLNWFKKGMGVLLLLTTAWLTWVLQSQTDSHGFLFYEIGLGLLFGAALLYRLGVERSRKKSSKLPAKLGIAALSLLAIGSLVQISHSDNGTDTSLAEAGWESYDEGRLQEHLKEGKTVFIDFTAKWCLICQVNKAILHNESVVKDFEDRKVVRMMADWTRMSPAITKKLQELGRSGVPVYVIYKGVGSEPVILPQVLTPEEVNRNLNAIEEKNQIR